MARYSTALVICICCILPQGRSLDAQVSSASQQVLALPLNVLPKAALDALRSQASVRSWAYVAKTPAGGNWTVPVPDLSIFGQGYDSATGLFTKNACVTMTKVIPSGGPFTGGTGQHLFNEVSDLTNVLNSSGTSASASILYDGFSLGAGGSVTGGDFSSHYSRYVVAYSRVILNEYQARGTGLNGNPELASQRLVSEALNDPPKFREECGDHFISGYQIGGVLSAVGSVTAIVDKDWSANKVNVSAGFAGIFGANFGASSNHDKFRTSSAVNLQDLSAGTLSGAVSLENLNATYYGYDAAVNAKPGFVAYVFTPYSVISSVAGHVPDFTALEGEELRQLAQKRDEARTNLNDVIIAQKAIANGYSYYSFDAPPPGTTPTPGAASGADARSALEDYLKSVASAADACKSANTPEGCSKAIDAIGAPPPSHVKVNPAP